LGDGGGGGKYCCGDKEGIELCETLCLRLCPVVCGESMEYPVDCGDNIDWGLKHEEIVAVENVEECRLGGFE
jgi:hypothetical protein